MTPQDDHHQPTPQNHNQQNSQALAKLAQFRQQMRNSLTKRPNAIMSLVDALSSNTATRSVAELSLTPGFGYQYPSVYDAIGAFFSADSKETADDGRREKEAQLMRLVASLLPPPKSAGSGCSASMSPPRRAPSQRRLRTGPPSTSPTPFRPTSRLPTGTSMRRRFISLRRRSHRHPPGWYPSQSAG